jgi:hypothetical protein
MTTIENLSLSKGMRERDRIIIRAKGTIIIDKKEIPFIQPQTKHKNTIIYVCDPQGYNSISHAVNSALSGYELCTFGNLQIRHALAKSDIVIARCSGNIKSLPSNNTIIPVTLSELNFINTEDSKHVIFFPEPDNTLGSQIKKVQFEQDYIKLNSIINTLPSTSSIDLLLSTSFRTYYSEFNEILSSLIQDNVSVQIFPNPFTEITNYLQVRKKPVKNLTTTLTFNDEIVAVYQLTTLQSSYATKTITITSYGNSDFDLVVVLKGDSDVKTITFNDTILLIDVEETHVWHSLLLSLSIFDTMTIEDTTVLYNQFNIDTLKSYFDSVDDKRIREICCTLYRNFCDYNNKLRALQDQNCMHVISPDTTEEEFTGDICTRLVSDMGVSQKQPFYNHNIIKRL